MEYVGIHNRIAEGLGPNVFGFFKPGDSIKSYGA